MVSREGNGHQMIDAFLLKILKSETEHRIHLLIKVDYLSEIVLLSPANNYALFVQFVALLHEVYPE